MRERAEAWSRDDFLVAQSTLETLDHFRDDVLANLSEETLAAATKIIFEGRARFEADPGIPALALWRDTIKDPAQRN